MNMFKPGDYVLINIGSSGSIVDMDKDGNISKVRILAYYKKYNEYYICLTGTAIDPAFYGSVRASDWDQNNEGYDIVPNMIDYNRQIAYWVDERFIREIITHEGSSCAKCKEFSRMSEPNQPDGKFICYSCRDNPWR